MLLFHHWSSEKFWSKEFRFLLQMNIVPNIVFQFLKIRIGNDAEKAISIVSLRQYHQYTHIYTSYRLHTMLLYREVELVMAELSQAAKLSGTAFQHLQVWNHWIFLTKDHSVFHIWKKDTNGYFKGCGNKEIAAFKQALWHLRACLWQPKQVFQAKTWSFPNSFQVGFGPKPNQITT